MQEGAPTSKPLALAGAFVFTGLLVCPNNEFIKSMLVAKSRPSETTLFLVSTGLGSASGRESLM